MSSVTSLSPVEIARRRRQATTSPTWPPPQTLLRLVQSVPSPKAEPIKLWLAKVGYERMQEMADPGPVAGPRPPDLAAARPQRQVDSAAHDRAGNAQQAHRLLGDHEIKEGEEFAILTNIIHQEWSGVSVKEHKELKGLKSHNLRDHMTEAELIFTALAELSTRQIAENTEATGLPANKTAAQAGGGIAKRRAAATGRPDRRRVVSGDNYLAPAGQERRLKAPRKG